MEYGGIYLKLSHLTIFMIHSFSLIDKDLCECRNKSIKFLCALLFYFILFVLVIRRPLNFFTKHFFIPIFVFTGDIFAGHW